MVRDAPDVSDIIYYVLQKRQRNWESPPSAPLLQSLGSRTARQYSMKARTLRALKPLTSRRRMVSPLPVDYPRKWGYIDRAIVAVSLAKEV